MKRVKRTIATLVAGIMAVTGLTMSANAYSETINLHKAQGAPSSDVVTYQSWTRYTLSPTQVMDITSLTRGNSTCYVHLYNPMGINADLYAANTVTKSNVTLGVQITLYVQYLNCSSTGSYYASGSVSG